MTVLQTPTYFMPLQNFQYLLKGKDVLWADTFPYSAQSFQNRMKIRTPQGFQWLTVPLKAGKSGKALDIVEVSYAENWQRQHWKSIENYYRASPFFEYFESYLFGFFQQKHETLAALNLASVACIKSLLDINWQESRLSDIAPQVTSMQEIGLHFPEKQWLSTPDLAMIFDKCELPHQEIMLPEVQYRQVFTGFVPNLSCLDLLLMYGEESFAVLKG